jgi:hypothetical protein
MPEEGSQIAPSGAKEPLRPMGAAAFLWDRSLPGAVTPFSAHDGDLDSA